MAVRLIVGVGSKMAAVKTICKFLLHFILISAVYCGSTEDFLSNYEEAEDEHNSQISSDNPTYSETSTHSGNSEPYLDMDVMTDEELQEAVTKQNLDVPETLNEVTIVSLFCIHDTRTHISIRIGGEKAPRGE